MTSNTSSEMSSSSFAKTGSSETYKPETQEDSEPVITYNVGSVEESFFTSRTAESEMRKRVNISETESRERIKKLNDLLESVR